MSQNCGKIGWINKNKKYVSITGVEVMVVVVVLLIVKHFVTRSKYKIQVCRFTKHLVKFQ